MKVFNLIFCVLFIVSAGLQYNDPDPYIWIPIYLMGAVICFQAFREKVYPVFTLLLSALFIIYDLYLFFDKFGVLSWLNEHNAENIAASMKASAPWIEETREFFGLLILIIVLMINYFVSQKSVVK
jgi:hypothetical protein